MPTMTVCGRLLQARRGARVRDSNDQSHCAANI